WPSTSEDEYDLEPDEVLSDLVYEIDYANLAAADDPECMADLYMDEFGLKKTDFKLDEYGNFDLEAGEPLLTIENKEAEIMKEMSTSELMDHCNRVLDLFGDRKSTRLNSSHVSISYAVFCLKKKKNKTNYN